MSDQYQIAIIGGGLIGGSISLALSQLEIKHKLLDIDPAATSKLIDKGAVFTEIPDENINLAIVSVSPDQCAAEVSNALVKYPNAIVIDTASVKFPILKALADNSEQHRYVGTHPMAGKEVSGAANSDVNLFADRIWIICPNRDNKSATDFIFEFISNLGSIVVQLDAMEHDRIVSKVSHLPQILSSTLASLIDPISDHAEIAGQGFRDMTRIAHSNADLWTQILLANRNHVLKDLDLLIDKVVNLKSAISGENRDDLLNYFKDSKAKADLLPGKHGGTKSQFGSISLRVKDEPGSLAALFQLANQLELNIEDVYIDHVINRPVAVVTLYFDAAETDRARAAYLSDGWQLRD